MPCCIIGARFYYVLFYLDLYRNTDGSLDWGAMFRIWDGGLAIYGAVIAGVLVALAYTKHHKLPFFAMGDVAVMGLLLGRSSAGGPISSIGRLSAGRLPCLADEAVGQPVYQHRGPSYLFL